MFLHFSLYSLTQMHPKRVLSALEYTCCQRHKFMIFEWNETKAQKTSKSMVLALKKPSQPSTIRFQNYRRTQTILIRKNAKY